MLDNILEDRIIFGFADNKVRERFLRDGGSIPVIGTVTIQVWRGSFTCLLLCCLVQNKGKGVIEIDDSDAIRQSDNSVGGFLCPRNDF